MELTNDEKSVIINALKKHLEEVKENEELIQQELEFLSAEVKYEEFVQGIIVKLNAKY